MSDIEANLARANLVFDAVSRAREYVALFDEALIKNTEDVFVLGRHNLEDLRSILVLTSSLSKKQFEELSNLNEQINKMIEEIERLTTSGN